MSIEKTVKRQSKRDLNGNFSALIAQVMFVLLVFITTMLLVSFVSAADKCCDDADGFLSGIGIISRLAVLIFPYMIIFSLPLINGVYRSACKIVLGYKTDAPDVFYYYHGKERFLKVLAFDITAILSTSIINLMFICLSYVTHILCSAVQMLSFWSVSAVLVVALLHVVFIFAMVVCCMLFLHYPLLVFGFYESNGVKGLRCFKLYFKFIRFSLKTAVPALRLLLSFIGWFALCFFVIPAVYVVPYYLTASARSVKWLSELNEDGGLPC